MTIQPLRNAGAGATPLRFTPWRPPLMAWLACSLVALSIHAAPGPLIIAHRGASGYLPEHTLAAKAMAHDLKLEVHPYTLRADALPGFATSLEDLLGICFQQAGVDGAFTDHPDRAAAFVRARDGEEHSSVKPSTTH